MDRVSISDEHLDVVYAQRPGNATSPATEAIVMMCPAPRASIDGSTARLHRNGPRTLTAITWSNSPAGVSWQVVACCEPVMPALLTSTSIPPSWARTVPIDAVMEDS